jgi:hypothetical protein
MHLGDGLLRHLGVLTISACNACTLQESGRAEMNDSEGMNTNDSDEHLSCVLCLVIGM